MPASPILLLGGAAAILGLVLYKQHEAAKVVGPNFRLGTGRTYRVTIGAQVPREQAVSLLGFDLVQMEGSLGASGPVQWFSAVVRWPHASADPAQVMPMLDTSRPGSEATVPAILAAVVPLT
jgi:hypothetical protein